MKKGRIFYFPDELIEKSLSPTCGAKLVQTDYFRENKEKFRNCIFFARGITNNKYCKQIKELNSIFFYIDTGYFGNINEYHNKNSSFKKAFHRIVLNQMQMGEIKKRDDSRYQEVLKYIEMDFHTKESAFYKPWKKTGKKIIICPPSEKVGSVFGIKIDQWIEQTVSEIKNYSDRKIIIRKKPEFRYERVVNPIQTALDDDIFILVTYNSIAATEAIIHGIPAITLGANAATSVSLNSLKDIENPIYPDRQLWLNNLSYEQFHINEIRDGTAWKYIKQNIPKNFFNV